MPADITPAAATSAESACQSGLEFLSRGDLTAACRSFETAIAIAPTMAQAHLGLGNSLRRHRQPREAEAALRRALALDPAMRDATYSLAYLLHGAGKAHELAAVLMELAAREPADITLQRQIAGLLMDFNCFEEAARLARKIAEAAPAAGAWQRLGVCLLQLQRLPEAEEAFNLAVHSNPLSGSAYLFMSQTRRATAADGRRLSGLRAILDGDKINGEARAGLHFALGNWLEDLGDYAGAWTQFSAGNRLRRDGRAFDRPAWEDYFKRLSETAVRHDRSRGSSQAPQPLFLIGFPGANPEPLASMITAHPAVSSLGAAEQIEGLARACEQLADKAYPECLASMGPTQLAGLEQGVRDEWPEKSEYARWVLDESPLNFLYLALIVQVFPGSRIVYQQGQPWDDCLSAHLRPFPLPTYTHVHDLRDLAFFYRHYSALMDQWQKSLPAQALLKFQANTALNGPAIEAGAVWKFLGLDAPATGETRPPASRSASSADPQRRDIPGRWRNYREHLAPVFEAAGLEPE